jgi:E3 ubiquitin-protein ligase UBR1
MMVRVPRTATSQLPRYRLRDTILKNTLARDDQLLKAADNPTNDLQAGETLAKTLGYSISAVEIQQRGVASLGGTTFLETIPQQALTHLRVLAESVASYVSIGGIRAAGKNKTAKEFSSSYECQHLALFLNRGSAGGLDNDGSSVRDDLDFLSNNGKALLSQDIFVFLTECSICLAPVDDINIMYLVRLCYIAEMVKVALMLSRHKGKSVYLRWINVATPGPQTPLDAFQSFCKAVCEYDLESGGGWRHITKSVAMEQPCFDGLESCFNFAKKYALAFLRKAAVLLHVRYGVAFHHNISLNPDADELDRLTEALRLPSFEKIFESGNPALHSLFKNWIKHANIAFFKPGEDKSKITISHPTIFELIGLPRNYDTLMEETMKRHCPTTGKDVSDPMLCLFCAEIFCGQSICCLKQGPPTRSGRSQQIGGAQQHMLKYVLPPPFHPPY